jgi:Mrp family chromosome partitioning ATPase
VPARRWIVLAVLVGALLGAAAGIGFSRTQSAQQSSALLDLGSAMSATVGDQPSPDAADRFIQSQLLYLNGAGFGSEVATAAGNPAGSSFTAAQVGTTNVVQLTAVSPKGNDAEIMAEAAAGLYATHRKAELTDQLVPLQAQLAVAQKDLATAQGQGNAQPAPANGASTVDLTVFQNRVNTLQGQVDALQASINSAAVGGSVLERAEDAGSSPTSSSTIAGGGGMAVGALLGLLLVAAPRLASRQAWAVEDAPDLGLTVLHPPVPAASRGWVETLPARRSDDRVESAARLIAARVAEPLAEGRPLVLVGAGPGVGTSFTAVNVATALARRRRTVLVPVGDVVDGQVAEWFGVKADGKGLLDAARATSTEQVEAALTKTPVLQLRLLTVPKVGRWEPVEDALAGRAIPELLGAGWAVVVDCPRMGLSTAAFELAPLHPVTGVVVDRGRTTTAELTGTVEQLPEDEKSQVAIVVNRRPRRTRSRHLPWTKKARS